LIYNGTSGAQITTGILTDAPGLSDQGFVVGSKDIGDIPSWN